METATSSEAEASTDHVPPEPALAVVTCVVGEALFATTTTMPGDVVSLPASSVAFAVRVCSPREAVSVFQENWKGAAVSGAPRAFPSRRSSTLETRPSSSAPTVTDVAPVTSSPAAGSETATVGETAWEPSSYSMTSFGRSAIETA